MDQTDKEKIALWKFGIIAPVISGTHPFSTNRQFYRHLAEKEFENPVSGVKKSFSWQTFAHWAYEYRSGGFDGLISRPRSDKGTSRTLSPEAQERIIALRRQYPRIINTVLRARLIEEGFIPARVSQSTIDRFVRSLPQSRLEPIHQGKERRAFEKEFANQVWQADTSYLYRLAGHRLYLVSILDDASRMIVGWGIFEADTAVNFQKILKSAVMTYGIPSVLYVDNGSPYDNHQLNMICARLGVALVHAPVRDGSAKGKQERAFRTFKDHWLRCSDWNAYQTIEEVRESFGDYLQKEYINRKHASLKDMTPRQRYLKDAQRFRFLPDEAVEQYFLHMYERKVRTDSTLVIDGISYEVPAEYMRETVKVKMDPEDRRKAWLLGTDGKLIPIRTVDKVENSRIRRRQHMRFREEE